MENKKTCLYDKHIGLGALMSPFGGFDMPIQYSNIIEEHNAVRHSCGVFDVSHMGEVLVTGPEAESFVQHIFTNDVSEATAGKIYYGMMLYDNGGTVDDLLVYCYGDKTFLLVINAANINKDIDWIRANATDFEVTIDDKCDYYGEVAVQGPKSESILENDLHIQCKELEFYTFKTISTDSETIIVSRTGYTGEDGFEIYGSHAYINKVWDQLMNTGAVKPCGLGCRDTLRFEVGLPLYGDELSPEISPIEAGLGIFVKADKKDFIGKDAIVKQKNEGVRKKLVGIALDDDDKAIPRHGYEVVAADDDDRVIGQVTTGYRTISTDKSVCMALVDAEFKTLGTKVKLRIHKKLHNGTVVKKSFYDKHYKK